MSDVKEAKPATQTLVTATTFSSEKFRLLELNPDVEKAILAGERVTIIGGENQRAVLCTSSNSFFMAKEDTSNLRLLTAHTEWSAEAANKPNEIETLGSCAFHYVLQPKVPDVSQLKTLLLQAPYTKTKGSPSAKRPKLHKLYTTSELMTELQTSEQELLAMLELLHAFQDAGSWRVLDPVYQVSVFGDILDAIIQNDWDFQNEGIAIDDVLRAVEEPEVVVRQCCRVYGTVHQSERCTFDSSKVAIFCAKQLFREIDEPSLQAPSAFRNSGDQGWTVDQFMDKWQLRVPEPVKVTEEMLRGLALVKTAKGKAARLQFFAEDELPMDPKQRFDKLFEVQDKWTVAQLEPYISALVRPGVTQASLLLKHARSSRQSNSNDRLYSKR